MVVSFFCKKCQKDQDLPGIPASYQEDRYFWANCEECGKKLVRYITEKNDPYYRQSIKLKKEREKLKIDLIQPSDSRFRLWYRQKWLEMEKAAEQYEEEQKKQEQGRLDFYNKHKHNVTERNLAKQVINIEEKWTNS